MRKSLKIMLLGQYKKYFKRFFMFPSVKFRWLAYANVEKCPEHFPSFRPHWLRFNSSRRITNGVSVGLTESDGREHGGVGAHGVGALPVLADVLETSAEQGGHRDCWVFIVYIQILTLFLHSSICYSLLLPPTAPDNWSRQFAKIFCICNL